MRSFLFSLALLTSCGEDPMASKHDVGSGQIGVVRKKSNPPEEYTDSDPTQMIPIGDMRMVTVELEDGSVQERLVHAAHARRLIQATLILHHDPGINPYNGEQTVRVTQMSVSIPELGGPYWWTTPSLEANSDYWDGAMVIEWRIQKVWRPDSGWEDESLQGDY